MFLMKRLMGVRIITKNSSTKVSEHIPSSFSMSTISSFKRIETKHDVRRRRDYIKK